MLNSRMLYEVKYSGVRLRACSSFITFITRDKTFQERYEKNYDRMNTTYNQQKFADKISVVNGFFS